MPIGSIAISAQSNYEIMKNSSEAAFMVYRKHFIKRKQHGNDSDSQLNYMT